MYPPDERRVLERLALTVAAGRTTVGLAFAADQAAARSLATKGVVTCAAGQGRDAGLLLVRRLAVAGRSLATPGGGDAA